MNNKIINRIIYKNMIMINHKLRYNSKYKKTKYNRIFKNNNHKNK